MVASASMEVPGHIGALGEQPVNLADFPGKWANPGKWTSRRELGEARQRRSSFERTYTSDAGKVHCSPPIHRFQALRRLLPGPGVSPMGVATWRSARRAYVMKWARRPLLCSCSHSRDAHRHYRPGSDCALCDCPRWSPWNPVSRLARRWGRLQRRRPGRVRRGGPS
jgi:hypothetical protein